MWKVKLLLWIFPFSKTKNTIEKNALVNFDSQKPIFSTDELSRAIKIVNDYVIGSTCLTRTLAGHELYSKYGFKTKIQIGVVKEEGKLKAHAWLEMDDKIVMGRSKISYTPILDFGGIENECNNRNFKD